MRIQFNIDDELMNAAIKAGSFVTKKETVEAGLRLLVQRGASRQLKASHQHLQTLARYNLWATQKLLAEHMEQVNEGDYRKDVGLFFKSIHGTLNHLLVGEHLLWFKRFSEGVSPVVQLNAEVEVDRALLVKRLLEGAGGWMSWLDALSDEQLSGYLNYTTMRGAHAKLPFVPTLVHVFNHATHHRGQITAALTMLGYPPPELDLVYFLQQKHTS